MDADTRPLHVMMTADTVGGVWTYAIELARQLCRRGLRVSLASLGAWPTPRQWSDAERIDGLTLHPSRLRLLWMHDADADVESANAWLLALAARLRPDIVHLNDFGAGSVNFACPTLLVAHSCVCSWWRAVRGAEAPADWDGYRQRVVSALQRATRVVAPSHAMARSLAQYGVSREVEVIHNARHAARRVGVAKQAEVLGAGRVWDEAKNLAALEGIAPQLDWPVAIAGDTRAPGSDDVACGTALLGMLDEDALRDRMQRASIFAHPARYEPFGLAVLEAAQARCALVLGDIPSLREVWGDAALYVPPDDAAALRDAINALCRDATLRADLAQRAQVRALRYSLDRMVGAYLAVYRNLLAGQQRLPQRQPDAAPQQSAVHGVHA